MMQHGSVTYSLEPSELRSKFIESRKHVFDRLEARNRTKYRRFLKLLGAYKYVSLSATRGHLLESYYLVMRSIDDVVDGDMSLPKPYGSAIEYVQGKLRYFSKPADPSDFIEQLYLYCLQLAWRLGISLSDETNNILNALLFDARRNGQSTVFSRAELNDHYEQLDIRGTIGAALKIFGEDPGEYMLLQPLGKASRISYDLADLECDIYSGVINIAQEDVESFGICTDQLCADQKPVQFWIQHQASIGLRLIEEHRANLRNSNLTLLTRAVLKTTYEMPARSYFNSLLDINCA